MTWPLTVAVKSCGCLDGDMCRCACQSTADRIELAHVAADPILLPHADLPALTDPALNVWRPGGDMVQAMCPPQRWQVTAEGVSVHLGAS